MKLPLLCKGYFSNIDGTNPTLLTPAANTPWTNALDTTHGDMVGVDIVRTDTLKGFDVGAGLPQIFNLQIGGIAIIQNALSSNFWAGATPGAYQILHLIQRGGQTLNFRLQFLDPAYVGGAIVHIMYENLYNNTRVKLARQTGTLKQKYIDFTETFPSGPATSNFKSTIPAQIGNVVAVQILAASDSDYDGISNALFSLAVDGTKIFDDCSLLMGASLWSRPTLQWPIVLRSGATLDFSYTGAGAAGASIRAGFRLFFDDSAPIEYYTEA
jgi:hypothetical protein